MDHVLVRFGEIGTKSRQVRRNMLRILVQRLQDRLAYEDVDASVRTIQGRLIVDVQDGDANAVAGALGELPGVVSASPAIRTEPDLAAIETATEELTVGATFGVDANVAGEHGFGSDDLNRQVGAHVEAHAGATVDLDDPETWVEIDVREEEAYVFTDRIEGPGGFPVSSQDPLAALISGGIDSPVAAHAAMTRGADVVPVYFYNRPFAAGDHLVRFEEAVDTLRRFHPGKRWYYHQVDMSDVNDRLMAVDGGRMLLHRIVMFRVAERIADRGGLAGLVTGESMGQKSSQTAVNLARTSEAVDLPVHRPLLTETKSTITQRAREIGTFESATVNSACRSIAPDSPSPEMARDRLASLARDVELEDLVDRADEATERVEL